MLVNPGAMEICDELITTAMALIDNVQEAFYYRDADNDGFGNQTDSLLAYTCLPPAGCVKITAIAMTATV